MNISSYYFNEDQFVLQKIRTTLPEDYDSTLRRLRVLKSQFLYINTVILARDIHS